MAAASVGDIMAEEFTEYSRQNPRGLLGLYPEKVPSNISLSRQMLFSICSIRTETASMPAKIAAFLRMI